MAFPQELHEMFIDYLHDDTSSLRKTSLVCKAWVPPSRYHLFRIVKLASRDLLVKWSKTFDTSAESPAHVVQTLILSRWFSLDDTVLSGLYDHFRSFDNVRELVIHDISFTTFYDKPLERYFGQLVSSVKSLELNRTMAKSPGEVMRFVSLFTKVDDLSIMGIHRLPLDIDEKAVEHPVSSTSPAFRGRFRLFTNTITSCGFLHSMSNLPNGARFKSIYLWLEKTNQLEHANRLLQLCADTLETLEIGHEFFDDLEEGAFSLEHNTVFKHLIVNLHEDDPLIWLKPILSTITSQELKITFVLSALHDQEYVIDEWNAIEETLIAMVDERSQRVNVVINAGRAWSDVEDAEIFVQGLLPRMKERGLFEVIALPSLL